MTDSDPDASVDRATKECEQAFERIRQNCEQALTIFRQIKLEELSAEKYERAISQIHALREMVRILSSDFGNQLMVQAAKLRRPLSRQEASALLYDLGAV
jgi:hypothetical protein